MRTAVLAGIVCALILGVIPSASADAWMKWKDQLTEQYMEVVEVDYPEPNLEHYVWQFGGDFYDPGLLQMDSSDSYHDCDFPQRLRVVGGGGSGDWRSDGGVVPIYVRLVASVKNTGTENWADFHLRGISGCNIYTKQVGQWSRGWDYVDVESAGWDYRIGPDNEESWGPEYWYVHPGEYFDFETWIEVTSPTGDFEVEFWPTVPEPGSLLALASGLLALGAGIRFRKR